MKRFAFAAVLTTTLIAAAALAQSPAGTSAQNSTAPATTPSNPEVHAGSAKGPQSRDSRNSSGNKNGNPNQSGTQGSQMNGPGNGPNNGNAAKNGPAFDPTQCSAQIPGITQRADACLNKKEFNQRKSCFDAIGSSFPPGFEQACQPMVEPLKQQLMAKEHSLYPNQASGLDGGNNHGANGNNNNNNGKGPNGSNNVPGGPNNNGQMNGPNNGQHHGQGNTSGQPTFDPSKCSAQIPHISKKADSCLTQINFDRRASCFGSIGDTLPQGFDQACQGMIEPLKQQYAAKEHALYPDQASAVEGNKNGSNGGPNSRGSSANNGQGQTNPHDNKSAKHSVQAGDCDKILSQIRKPADECLAIANQPKRKACFDKVGKKAEKLGGDKCQDAMNALKSDYQSKESSTYPGEPASIN